MKTILIGDPLKSRGYSQDMWGDQTTWREFALWGRTFNEQYDTVDDYKTSNPPPLTDNTLLVGAVGADLPPESDSSWDGWNNDPTYTFTIIQQALTAYPSASRLPFKLGLFI